MLSIREAAKRVPCVRGGRSPHPGTLARWIKYGLLTAAGQRIRLESWRIGGTPCTSLEALDRFFSRLNDKEAVDIPATPKQKQFEKQAEAAMKTLAKRGFIQSPA